MLLPINPYSSNNTNLSFKYQHPLKDLWRAGKLHKVTRGLYGDVLTQRNLSLEHLIPHSKGGKTRYENLALASMAKNNARGSASIKGFLTPEMAQKYLDQFKGIVIKGKFYGNSYIKGIKRTLERLGIKLP